jgi:transposase
MQYSDDLRQKLVDAWKAGYGTQAELAEWFGVSLRWVEKVLRRWRTTGQTAARSVPTRPTARYHSSSPGATGPAASGGDVGRIRPPF